MVVLTTHDNAGARNPRRPIANLAAGLAAVPLYFAALMWSAVSQFMTDEIRLGGFVILLGVGLVPVLRSRDPSRGLWGLIGGAGGGVSAVALAAAVTALIHSGQAVGSVTQQLDTVFVGAVVVYLIAHLLPHATSHVAMRQHDGGAAH